MLGFAVVTGVAVVVQALIAPAPDARFATGLPNVARPIDVAGPVFAFRTGGAGVFARFHLTIAVDVPPEPAALGGLTGRRPAGVRFKRAAA